jgi:hypothetical protein
MTAKKKPRSAAQKAATTRMLKAAAAKRRAATKKKPLPPSARKRRPPARVTKRKAAPLAQRIEQAAKLSQDFHGSAATRVTRVAMPAQTVAMVLGTLEGVIYRTPEGTKFLHEFRGTARPRLAATHDGAQLIVQGGRYRMTDRGIVDQSKRK